MIPLCFFADNLQCIAAIACAELPMQQWPELIQTLVQNVTNGTASESLKEQTLEAIGYICQDIVCEIIYFLFKFLLFIVNIGKPNQIVYAMEVNFHKLFLLGWDAGW